jgi:redox-sensing transcriptional repressor
MYDVVREKDIGVAIIAVPSEEAQEVANLLVSAGVRGLVNFAPVRLCVPEGVYVENVDMSMTLERVAYFASEGKTAVPAGSGKESASHGNNLNG